MQRRTLGIVLVVSPFILLPLVLLIYAVMSLMVANGSLGASSGQIVRLILGLGGFIAILGIFIAVPIGGYLIVKHDVIEAERLRTQARAKLNDEEYRKLDRWSWSAFLNTFIFAVGNQLWDWAFISILPIINIWAWIYIAIHGRRLAWERDVEKSHDNLPTFLKRQKIIAYILWGFVIFSVLMGLLPSLMFVKSQTELATSDTMSSISGTSSALEQASSALCEKYQDTDNDGLRNKVEATLGTDPTLTDTDGDGYTDFQEVLSLNDPLQNPKTSADPKRDSDHDNLPDYLEDVFFGTSTLQTSSDLDETSDGDEVMAGTNPKGTGSLDDYLAGRAQKDAEKEANYCN